MRTARFKVRTLGVMVGVALVAMVVGAGLRGAADPSPPSTARPTPVVDGDPIDEGEVGPGPWDAVEGIGVGFSHDEAGAVAAAVTYGTAPQVWLYLSDDQVAVSADAVIVERARDELVPRLVEDARLLRTEVTKAAGTVWFVVAPLATKVESYTDERAVVRVWVVRVVSADGVAVPQSGWQTLRLDLAWESGDWRIAAVDEAEGPTPQLEAGVQPWAADYLGAELAGFRRVGAP
jgi:hypothetical protein